METIRKQARQFREKVATQQQAVFRQFSGRFGIESSSEGTDQERHQKLQILYDSTRAAKHFQRKLVYGIEGVISTNVKQMEIATKLAEDCCKFGNQNVDLYLAKASIHFGNSHKLIEKERESLLKVLGDQVFETLREMISSAPLEDARHLTYRYERIRQDVESQAIEVVRRQLKSREANANAESMSKLEHAESRLSELKSTMEALGKEATIAMTSVDNQQQEATFQELLTMVEAEKTYHENSASILNRLYREMIQEKQQAELEMMHSESNLPNASPVAVKSNESHSPGDITSNGQDGFFIAEVVHPFEAQADGELSLSIGDYVVVRKVLESGWSEGECNGTAGCFPSAYVSQCNKTPASKLSSPSSPELSEKSHEAS